MTKRSRSGAPSLARTVRALRRLSAEAPQVALVLGSGLGDLADSFTNAKRVSYGSIEGMTDATVPGHAGRFVLGHFPVAGGTLPIIAMQGRIHLYEGHSPDHVVLGVRAMLALGARTLIVTNAAGGIREDLAPGTLMLICDHLNLTGHSCLVGPNDDALGPRFPQLSDAYDAALLELASDVGAGLGVATARGVYAGLLGPSYETPAEVRMLRTLGADAVGMSTVLEVIAARHMGVRCLGISCITNRAAGLSATAPTHAEVESTAAATRERFGRLIEGVLAALAAQGATP